MLNVFLILIVIVAILLILVIMVQNPKGGGLSGTFGGGAAQVGGAQQTTNFLDKSTWTLAVVMGALILLSNIAINKEANSSVKDAMDNQTTPVETNAPAPITLPENNTPAKSNDSTGG